MSYQAGCQVNNNQIATAEAGNLLSQEAETGAEVSLPVSGEIIPQESPKGTKRLSGLKLLLVPLCLVLLALLLTACAYPGQTPPCSGENANQPGCVNPVSKESIDPKNDGAGEWFIDWAFKILRQMVSSFAIGCVKLGVSVFWSLFSGQSSLDFASCGNSLSNGTPPGGQSVLRATCAANDVFLQIRNIAFAFFGLLIAWKFFKSYFLGAVVDGLYESAISFTGKLLLGAFSLTFLALLVSGAFGLSNELFSAISGGPEELNRIATNLVGVNGQSGVGSLGNINNLGLLIFLALICLFVALEFIALGVIFLLRTILVFILFACSPLAVVAGLSEEMRPWFDRWLGALQAMLIAPIPVAISLRMVQAFSDPALLSSADTNPPQFLLQLVYLASFLLIACLLMFKIAGSVGGFVFGLAAGAFAALGGAAVGYAMGSASGLSAGAGRGKAGAAGSGGGTGEGSGAGAGGGEGSEENPSGGSPFAGGGDSPLTPGAGSLYGSSRALGAERRSSYALPAPSEAASRTNSTGTGAGWSSDSAAAADLGKSLRALNENLAAFSSSRTTSSSLFMGGWQGQGFPGGFGPVPAYTSPAGYEDGPSYSPKYGSEGTSTGGRASEGAIAGQEADQENGKRRWQFHHGTAYGLHNLVLWAGEEAGLNAPYVSFAPLRRYGGTSTPTSVPVTNGRAEAGTGGPNPGASAGIFMGGETTTSETILYSPGGEGRSGSGDYGGFGTGPGGGGNGWGGSGGGGGGSLLPEDPGSHTDYGQGSGYYRVEVTPGSNKANTPSTPVVEPPSGKPPPGLPVGQPSNSTPNPTGQQKETGTVENGAVDGGDQSGFNLNPPVSGTGLAGIGPNTGNYLPETNPDWSMPQEEQQAQAGSAGKPNLSGEDENSGGPTGPEQVNGISLAGPAGQNQQSEDYEDEGEADYYGSGW
ncbi:MAG TPA: type IV secretion system protein [Chloroflexia bacterium]|nr:type IV secretion system protein [Chloroflexia bacterium]